MKFLQQLGSHSGTHIQQTTILPAFVQYNNSATDYCGNIRRFKTVFQGTGTI